MASKLYWHGLDELREQLRTLAPRLAGETLRLVQAEANAAAVTIRSNYGAHRHTGKLQASVSVTTTMANGRTPTARVRAGATHAAWFEFGTAGQHRVTEAGYGRGILPAAPPLHAFYPVIFKHRRIVRTKLALLLRREGLTPREVAGAA